MDVDMDIEYNIQIFRVRTLECPYHSYISGATWGNIYTNVVMIPIDMHLAAILHSYMHMVTRTRW